jgi:hypothetical protein
MCLDTYAIWIRHVMTTGRHAVQSRWQCAYFRDSKCIHNSSHAAIDRMCNILRGGSCTLLASWYSSNGSAPHNWHDQPSAAPHKGLCAASLLHEFCCPFCLQCPCRPRLSQGSPRYRRRCTWRRSVRVVASGQLGLCPLCDPSGSPCLPALCPLSWQEHRCST